MALRNMADAARIADQYRKLDLLIPDAVTNAIAVEIEILAAIQPTRGPGAVDALYAAPDSTPTPKAVLAALNADALAGIVRLAVGQGANDARRYLLPQCVRALRAQADATVDALRDRYTEAAALVIAALGFFPAEMYNEINSIYGLGDRALSAHRAAADAIVMLNSIAQIVDTLGGFDGVTGAVLYAQIGTPETHEAATLAFSGNKPARWLHLFSVEGVTPRLHNPTEAEAQLTAIGTIINTRAAEVEAERQRQISDRKEQLQRERGISELRPGPARPKTATRR